MFNLAVYPDLADKSGEFYPRLFAFSVMTKCSDLVDRIPVVRWRVTAFFGLPAVFFRCVIALHLLHFLCDQVKQRRAFFVQQKHRSPYKFEIATPV